MKDKGVTTTDVTPEDFAAREEMSQQAGWSAGSVKKTKKKVRPFLTQHKLMQQALNYI